MVDLDSDPTKLIEIVEIGKQLLITRGALTTFSHRQRHRQVLRDHPGHVRRRLPGPGRAEHHAAAQPDVGDPVRGHLQRARHRRADPAGPARRALPPVERGGDAAPQPARSTASAASSCRSSASSSSTCSSSSSQGSRDASTQLGSPNTSPRCARCSSSPSCSGWSTRSRWSRSAQLPGLDGTRPTARWSPSAARRSAAALIGQSFTDADGNPLPQYFQSRPSAAGDGYDPTATSRRNLGPESVVDTLPDPADPDDAGTQSLLTQVCARSLARRRARGRRRRRPFCTADGVGAVLGVFHARRPHRPGHPGGQPQPGLPGHPVPRDVPGRDGASAPSSARTTPAAVVTPIRGDAPATPGRPGRRGHRQRQRPRPGSARPTRSCRHPGSREGPRHPRRRRAAGWSTSTPRAGRSASWVSRRSTCSSSTSPSTGRYPYPQRTDGRAGPERRGAADDVTRSAARLPRGRPRRRQDLHDARGGPPARRDRGTDVVVGFVETPRPPAHRGACSATWRWCRAARSTYRGRRRSPRWTSTRCSPAGPRSRWSTSWPTPTCPARRNAKRWQDIQELLDAGHHRAHHGQRPAPGVAQRRRRADHRRAAAGDRARRGGPRGPSRSSWST